MQMSSRRPVGQPAKFATRCENDSFVCPEVDRVTGTAAVQVAADWHESGGVGGITSKFCRGSLFLARFVAYAGPLSYHPLPGPAPLTPLPLWCQPA